MSLCAKLMEKKSLLLKLWRIPIMNNVIKSFYLLFAILFLNGCIDDKGNYSYISADELFPVEISGLSKKMTVNQGENLVLSPILENMDKEERYSYVWTITEKYTDGKLPERRLIAENKDLDFKVVLDAGSWLLNFEVRDQAKDLYKRWEIDLTIMASPINVGWYVLKDKNSKTDFDYIDTEGVAYRNVLGASENALEGEAVRIFYQNSGYTHQIENKDGTVANLANQSVLHILSTKDIRVFNSKNLSLFKTFDDLFYDVPEKCFPQTNYVNSSGSLFLINDGLLYSTNGMNMNIGKYSTKKTGNYYLFGKIIPTASFDVMVFDTKSNSFYSVSPSGVNLNHFSDKPVDLEPPVGTAELPQSASNMEYTMKNLGVGMPMGLSASGFAIMKSTVTGEYFYVRIDYRGDTTYPFTSFTQIPAKYLILSADVVVAPLFGNFSYFSKGNALYYYLDSSSTEVEREIKLLELPANERIAYLEHIHTGGGITTLAVLSNTDSGWKLRLYDPIGLGSPEINIEPTKVFEGEGNGRFVMYREY